MFERNGVLYIDAPGELKEYKGEARLAYNSSYHIFDTYLLYLRVRNEWIGMKDKESTDVLSRLWGSGNEVI